MQSRTAPIPSRREPWPPREIEDDDDQTPIEEWTLDEVDSDFDFVAGKGSWSFDAAIE